MIDTSYTTDDENNQDTLIKAERNAAYANYYCKGRLGRDAIVDLGGLHFKVPSDEEAPSADASRFSVSRPGFADQSDYPDVELYKVGKETSYYDTFLTREESQDIDGDTYIALISDITEEVDPEDEDVKYKMIVFMNGAKTDYFVEDDAKRIIYTTLNNSGNISRAETLNIKDFDRGDVVRFGFKAGKIYQVEMLYDYSAQLAGGKPGIPDSTIWQAMNGTNNDWFNGASMYQPAQPYMPFQLSFGFVNKVDGSVIGWGYRSPDVIDEVYNQQTHYIVYNHDTDNMYMGTIDDVKDYQTYGNDCSRIILQHSRGYFRSMIVFN
jgi:hypothetical protein